MLALPTAIYFGPNPTMHTNSIDYIPPSGPRTQSEQILSFFSDFSYTSTYFPYCPTKSTSNSASECGKLHRRAVPRWWKGAAFKLNVKQLAHSNHCFMLEKVVSQLVGICCNCYTFVQCPCPCPSRKCNLSQLIACKVCRGDYS